MKNKMCVRIKRARVDDSGTMDRISDLPRNILGKILEHLPIRDAVRTSILSSKWRYNWTAVQRLDFDVKFISDHKNKTLRTQSGFLRTINKVLLLHCQPIIKFDLYIPDFLEEHQDIDLWILFLSRNDIEELCLDNSSMDCRHEMNRVRHKLPSYIFSCLTLTELKLNGFIFKPPPGFSGFPHLKSLDVKSITFQANEHAQALFFSSISLERLIISRCEGVRCLCIYAPALKVFHFELGGIGMFVSFSDSSVVNLSQALTPNFFQSLSFLPQLEKLILPGPYFMGIPAGGVPKVLPMTLDSLKNVNLSYIDFHELNEISVFLCLIRSCPNLQELEVSILHNLQTSMQTSAQVVAFLKSLNCSECMLYQLRFVKMQSINGIDIELEFIKYLLASSPKLELFSTRKPYSMKECDALRTCSQLLRLPRASSKAKIAFEL